jgi:hypothetical protein
MSRAKRLNRETEIADVSRHMADAVLYLSQVAEDAGLKAISSELMTIGQKLSGDVSRETSRRPKIVHLKSKKRRPRGVN